MTTLLGQGRAMPPQPTVATYLEFPVSRLRTVVGQSEACHREPSQALEYHPAAVPHAWAYGPRTSQMERLPLDPPRPYSIHFVDRPPRQSSEQHLVRQEFCWIGTLVP